MTRHAIAKKTLSHDARIRCCRGIVLIYLVIALVAVCAQTAWKVYDLRVDTVGQLHAAGVAAAAQLAGEVAGERAFAARNVADILVGMPQVVGVLVKRGGEAFVISGIVDVAAPAWRERGALASLSAVTIPLPEGALVLYYDGNSALLSIAGKMAWQLGCFLLGVPFIILWTMRLSRDDEQKSARDEKSTSSDVFADEPLQVGNEVEEHEKGAGKVDQDELTAMFADSAGPVSASVDFSAGPPTASEVEADVQEIESSPNHPENQVETLVSTECMDCAEQIVRNLHEIVIFRVVIDGGRRRRFVYLGPCFEEMFGVPVRNALADASVVYRQIVLADRIELERMERESLQNRDSFTLEVQMHSLSSSEPRWVQFRVAPNVTDDGEQCLDGVLLDMTILRQVDEQVKEMAEIDGLTRLANRRLFMRKADEEIMRFRRYGNPVSLVMLDADHFKRVNDTYGHDVGDEVLVALARTMRENARSVDTPARFGGEEFIMVLPETDAEQAAAMAERLREAVEKLTIVSGEYSLNITVSVGVATLDTASAANSDGSLNQLLKQADEALYAAKQDGRNRVVTWRELLPTVDEPAR